MAADCSSNNSDCLPAGSTSVNPCSPCLEPTKENFLSTLAEVARQVCAVGNQVKTFNQRIDRVRNRMERLERELANLPDPEEAVGINDCVNLDSATEFSALVGCDDGTKVSIVPSDEGCSNIIGKDGLWQVVGPKVVWLATPQVLINGVNTSLNQYEEAAALGCEVFAHLKTVLQVSSPNSSTSGLYNATANGHFYLGAVVTMPVSFDQSISTTLVRLTSENITLTFGSSLTGTPTISRTVSLLGYTVY